MSTFILHYFHAKPQFWTFSDHFWSFLSEADFFKKIGLSRKSQYGLFTPYKVSEKTNVQKDRQTERRTDSNSLDTSSHSQGSNKATILKQTFISVSTKRCCWKILMLQHCFASLRMLHCT